MLISEITNSIKEYERSHTLPQNQTLQLLLYGDIKGLAGINLDGIMCDMLPSILKYLSRNVRGDIWGSRDAVNNWINNK